MERATFPCDKCGLCCEHLSSVPLYADLDRGDGVCKYFDAKTRLCTIYSHRPKKCNVAAGYQWFQDQMDYETYLSINEQACKKLKEMFLCHYPF